METLSDSFAAIEKVREDLSTAKKEHRVSDIKIHVFQDIMNRLRKLGVLLKSDIEKHLKEISKLNDVVLDLLTDGELSCYCQLVAAKVFYAGIVLQYDSSVAIKKCTDILKVKLQEFDVDKSAVSSDISFSSRIDDSFSVCLCLALLESNNKMWIHCDINHNIMLLDIIYPICEKIAFKYTHVTLLAFKGLVKIFNLLHSLNKSDYILPDKYVLRTMNIIMANWENPLTSIRDQNSLLFFNFLLLTEKKQWFNLVCVDKTNFSSELFENNTLLYLVFNHECWMTKSKYYLLAEILKTGNTCELVKPYRNELIIGLKISLKFTYLAAAGSNLYTVCTSRMKPEEWEEMLLPTLIEVLKSDGNDVMKQNLVVYWTSATLISMKAFYVMYDTVNNLKINNLKSFILLLKVGRKKGIIERGEIHENLKTGSESEKLKICLVHSDASIRADAFFSICVSQTVCIPTIEELNMIKRFLIENINYDSSSFRQSIVNSCTTLFVRFRDSFLVELKSNKMSMLELCDREDLKFIADFIFWFHSFLISNLEEGCNFQRMYTSLLMYEIVLNYLGSKNRTLSLRKGNNRDFGIKLREYVEKLNKWNFTSDKSKKILFSCILNSQESIRITAANILSNYFHFTESDLTHNEILKLYHRGIDLCSDKFFYNVESGAWLLETITIMIYKNDQQNNSSDSGLNCNKILTKLLNGKRSVLCDLLGVAEKQKCELFKDILKAASNGSPLHGVLTAIQGLLTNRKSPEFGSLSPEDIEKILVLLENVIEKLLNALSSNSKITDFAPSFADMGEAIETIAHQSSLYDKFDDNDEEIQLSSAHQLIMNCIWLNIKTCCSLAEKLVTSGLLDRDIKSVERCVDLLVFVLRRFRHKGAIEAAGLSVMQVTKYLTSHNNIKFREIPGNILKEIFDTLMLSESGTVSRRSAGLSILVHRIIVGDCSEKKPLLHSSMVKLLDIASKSIIENYNELADSPKVRALHFICSLVQDSSLRQELAYHIHDIAILCFNNLPSNIWAIRNASLQLFGALLPKLVGTKKLQENVDGYEIYAAPLEELYFHMKNLFDLIEKQLSVIANTNNIISHSQLMPSLTLLSNLTVTMYPCINMNLRNIVNKFNDHLEKLFSSGIYHIRRLSAQINCNFCIPSLLIDLIKMRTNQIMGEFKQENSSKNKLDGLCMNLKFLLIKYYKLKESLLYLKKYEKDVLNSLRKLCVIIKSTNIPSFIKALVSDILRYDYVTDMKDRSKFFIDNIRNDVGTKNIDKDFLSKNIGFPAWCYSEIHSLFLNCNLDEIQNYVKVFLNDSTVGNINISCLKCLKLRIINMKNCNAIVLNGILNILIDFVIERKEIEIISVAFDVILTVIKQMKNFGLKNDHVDKMKITNIFDKYLKNYSKYGRRCSSLATPVICSYLSEDYSVSLQKNVVCLIKKWSDPDEHDEDARFLSVESLYQIIPFLNTKTYEDNIGVTVWECICKLLQDENVNIRIEATKFTTEFYRDKFNYKLRYINPHVSLRSMYRIDFMVKLMTDRCAIKCLWVVLDIKHDILENERLMEQSNPFDNASSNIYEEDVKIVDLVFSELLRIISMKNYRSYLYDIVKNENFNVKGVVNKDFLIEKKLICKNKIHSQLIVSEP